MPARPTGDPSAPLAVPVSRIASDRAATVVLVARIRFAAIGLSAVMVALARPVPISPAVLVILTAVMAVYNVPALLARRLPPAALEPLICVVVCGDFVVCTAWVLLTGNDPGAGNYVTYMLVAAEAAVMFAWTGTIAFAPAFMLAFAGLYWESAVVYHYSLSPATFIYRSTMVLVMSILAGGAAAVSYRYRLVADGAASEATAAAAEATRDADRAAALYNLASPIGRTLDAHTVLESTMDALLELFPQRWHGILLADDATGSLRLAHPRGTPRELEIPIPSLAAMVGRDAFLFKDLWHHPDFVAAGIAMPPALSGYTGAAVIALRTPDRFLGVLVSLDRAAGRFPKDEVHFLEAVGRQISGALDNARLYEEIHAVSLTDPLTGLANRRCFDRRLEVELARSERYRTPLAVLMLDVDDFKGYNDTHGHPAGDAILERIAQVLTKDVLRETDLASRHGGDEFAVIMPATDGERALMVAQRLCQRIRLELFPHGGLQPGGRVTVSVGVAAWSVAAKDSGALVDWADLALYAAKEAGRDRASLYSPWLAGSLPNWTVLVPQLLGERTIDIVYQPICRLSGGGDIVGYEALARPPGGDCEMRVEGLFKAAQRLGVLLDLDWLCRQQALAGAAGMDPRRTLFINISASALFDPDADPPGLALLARVYGHATGDIVLEISEREAIRDMRQFRETLRNYRKEGFRFALDDVGEGFSTIEVLAAADPEYIKIARSLTVNAASSGPASAIRALVEFARSNGAEVIAEGIGEGDAETMRKLGVQFGQGFGLGRPMRWTCLPEAAVAGLAAEVVA